MKKKITFISLLLTFLTLLAGCKKEQLDLSYNRENDKFIEAVSPLGIGRLAPISVSFVYEPKCPMGEAISLYPPQKGTWEFNERRATFTPDVPYKADSTIMLVADCGKLFGEGKANNLYKHAFMVSSPKFDIAFDEIRYNEADHNYVVSGNVTTDIPVSLSEVSKTVSAKLAKKAQTVNWEKSDKDNIWNFNISNIPSGTKTASLNIKWDAKSVGLTKDQNKLVAGSKEIQIPASSDFSIMDVNTSKQNTILVSFSKALDKAQDTASFVRALDAKGLIADHYTTSIRGNILTIYSDSNFSNINTLSFEPGLRSSDGVLLALASTVTVSTKWETPAIRFTTDNVILPTSQGAILPIETKNLSGVTVQVYAIYERNITQFLQDNDLPQTYNLYRVGEPVWEKKMSFKWDDSMQNKYISNGLDLSSLVDKYPNGMFHIRVTFRPDQIKYVCSNNHDDFSNLPAPPESIEPYQIPYAKESSYWDSYEKLNSKERNSYWYHSGDPCHPAFYLPGYNSSCIISKNILISDVGIMAKKDNSNNFFVTVSDIKSAKPLANIPVEMRNYVGSVIEQGKTNSDGYIKFSNADKAYVITATNKKQTSYLKIADGTELSTSHFEVGGEKSENGVKGYIYGERDVWRPGDKLFLTFVLQDLLKTMPEDIPVKFELIDPLGRVTDTQVLTESVNGFYAITTKTAPTATTGLWTGRVSIGGKTWTKYLSIEAVIPNKLSIELSSDKEVLSSSTNNFTVKGAWLHGAPTPGYRTDVSVAFTNAGTSFDSYSDYTFTNLENSIEQSRNVIFNGNLEDNSEVTFSTTLDAGRKLPGKLNANFITRIYEPSGGVSTQSTSMLYSPYSKYVGIKLPKGDEARNMLLTDVDHTVDVVLLDENGKSVSSSNLTYTVYKIEWKWWWEKDAYTSATHVSSSYYNKVASGSVYINDGKGSFKFQVKYPDWGRYLVEVKDGNYGHSASKIVYIDWPGWAGRSQDNGSGSSAMVPLTASKSQYTVGETAEISFTANSIATAYVTVEKGGTVISQSTMETVEGTNIFRLPLKAEMAPNIYVHVTLVQPHMQTANSLPIRLYGVVPVMVDNPKTKLTPVITTTKNFEPNKKATISVSEKSGRPMTYTIAVVDEGLLGLTNYHAPDLRKEFYKKEASELRNWDIYRYVMSAYSGKLQTILSIGGSEEIIDNSDSNENRFSPVVKYFGPFYLEAGEKKATTFEMPYYVGAVRAVVIAGNEGAYGKVEKTIPVKSPLMAQASIPRTLGSNESVIIPVTVFNGVEEDVLAKVTLSSTGAVETSQTKTLEIPANGMANVEFLFETGKPGPISITASAKTDKKVSEYTTELEVLSRGIPVTYKSTFELKSNASGTISVKSPTEKGTEKLTLELSRFPQIDLNSRLSYLIEYPHGCIEQITSGGFPQLFVGAFSKLSPEQTIKVKDNIQSVFDRYSTYQTNSGAMGYWPGNQEAHPWGTCYSSHFMLEAKRLGYSVPENILEAELKWLADSADSWTSYSNQSAAVQAYKLFVLSLAGKPNLSAMNRLESSKNLDNEANLLLAAAYAYAGRKDLAASLCRKYRAPVKQYRSTGGDFSSNIRESAMYIYACLQSDFISQVPGIAKTLASELSSDRWLSTQETAWALYALLPYYSEMRNSTSNTYTVECNGVKQNGSVDQASVTEILTPQKNTNTQYANVTNTGKGILYGTLSCSGTSVAGSELRQNEGISMTVSGLENITNMRIGDIVNYTVTVKNTSGKEIKNMALTVPVPTCLEFTNERVGQKAPAYNWDSGEFTSTNRNSAYTYQDIRDEAIYTYFDLPYSSSSATYTFTATVAYTGNFYIPAIHAEAMYDNSIRAVEPGRFIKMN